MHSRRSLAENALCATRSTALYPLSSRRDHPVAIIPSRRGCLELWRCSPDAPKALGDRGRRFEANQPAPPIL